MYRRGGFLGVIVRMRIGVVARVRCTRLRERGRVLESEDSQGSAEVVPVINAVTSELRGIELKDTQRRGGENGH